MVTLPAATAVTLPVLSTVAMAGLEDTHALLTAATPVPLNCAEPPIQRAAGVPLITGAA